MLETWKGRAYMINPSPLLNVIHPAQASSGSARLASYFEGEDEAITDYIVLHLTKGWGLWNRVRSIIWEAMFANLHRLGLFVLWQVSYPCDLKIDEIFLYFEEMARSICGGRRWHLPFLSLVLATVYI